MKVVKTKIKNRDFKLAIAETAEEKTKGLSNTNNLKDDAGMLFVFDKEQTVSFNTTKMNYPIDMIFLDSDWDVIDYQLAHPGNNYKVDRVHYVVEVNAGKLPSIPGANLSPDEDVLDYVSDIKFEEEEEESVQEVENISEETPEEEETTEDLSDQNIIITRIEDTAELEVFRRGGKVIKPITDKIKQAEKAMQVLDDTGVILMNITGGERIFSRKHTAELVSAANKVKSGKMSNKEFGKLMERHIIRQDTQDPEYVYE